MKSSHINYIIASLALLLESTQVYANRLTPTAPQLPPVTNTIYVGDIDVPDHSDPNNPLSIQYFLNQATPGDEIVISDNKIYAISNRLVIPNGIRLIFNRLRPWFSTKVILTTNGLKTSINKVFSLSHAVARMHCGMLRVDEASIALRL